MKTRLTFIVAVAFLFCMANSISWAQGIKIGVLNMKKLQMNSTAFHQVREELRKQFDSLQIKLDQEREKIEKLEEEFKRQSMLLSLDAKEGKQKDLEKKTRHYRYLYEDVTQEMKDAEFEATRKVGEAIEKVVEKIAKEEGYTIILEEGTMGLIFYDNAIDITDQVTRAYDASQK